MNEVLSKVNTREIKRMFLISRLETYFVLIQIIFLDIFLKETS